MKTPKDWIGEVGVGIPEAIIESIQLDALDSVANNYELPAILQSLDGKVVKLEYVLGLNGHVSLVGKFHYQPSGGASDCSVDTGLNECSTYGMACFKASQVKGVTFREDASPELILESPDGD